jgi:chromosome partitioning related protein ParA
MVIRNTRSSLRIFAAISTKGGVGKTTLLANLGGLIADTGARVLLLDADTQPSLTKYYSLAHEARFGLVETVMRGEIDADCVSRTSVEGLHIVRSNDGEGELQHWLHDRSDRRTRLQDALSSPFVHDNYDVVLIDTQGAIGPLQTAAAFAADTLISPLPPDTPSVREFKSGTLAVLQRLEQSQHEPTIALAPIKAVICRFDYSRDAKGLLRELAEEFHAADQVSLLTAMVPNAVAYKDAFTMRLPVHRHSVTSGARMPSGYEVMHRIMWELFPDSYGVFSGGKRGIPEEVFGSVLLSNDARASGASSDGRPSP